MSESKSDSPTAPVGIRLLLIALLPLLVLLLYLQGQDYQSDLVDFRVEGGTGGSDARLFPDRIAGLERIGQIRPFNKDNLYEYINGHAEYFIGAGFTGLSVGEFGATADKQPRLVINLYDMGKPLNAFGVLVEEAGDQETVAVGSMGFKSGQGVSFIHGPYYVQVSLFDADLSAVTAAQAMAEALNQVVNEADLAFRFPDFGPVKSTRFVREYYRGMDILNRVLERTFVRDGEELLAFMVSGTPDEIAALTTALNGFLADEGIRVETSEQNGLTFYQVDDKYEGRWFYLPLNSQLLGAFSPLNESLVADIHKYVGTVAQETKPVSDSLSIPE